MFIFVTCCYLPLASAMDLVWQSDARGVFSDSDSDSVVVSANIQSYLDEKINLEWSDQTSFDKDFGFVFDDDVLYLFAFDTGQANCIILRIQSCHI